MEIQGKAWQRCRKRSKSSVIKSEPRQPLLKPWTCSAAVRWKLLRRRQWVWPFKERYLAHNQVQFVLVFHARKKFFLLLKWRMESQASAMLTLSAMTLAGVSTVSSSRVLTAFSRQWWAANRGFQTPASTCPPMPRLQSWDVASSMRAVTCTTWLSSNWLTTRETCSGGVAETKTTIAAGRRPLSQKAKPWLASGWSRIRPF